MANRVIIVGAGLAGLTAARELLRRGVEVPVVEARDRVGGRTLAQATAIGDSLDLGGQWIGPTQDRMAALVDEFGLQSYTQYNSGTKLSRVCGRNRQYTGSIPSMPLLSLLDFQLLLNRLDRLSSTIDLEAPHGTPRASEWDGMTVEAWKRRHVKTATVRATFDTAVAAIFAADPAELSFLHFLFYLRSGGGFLRLAEVINGAQETRVHGGMQAICERMAQELGERVLMNAPVRAIRQSDTRVSVVTDRGAFEGERVIVAVPPVLAGQIDYSPELPPARVQLTQRMPMGSVIKCIAIYASPFWRDAGLSGEVVTDVGPVKFTFDDTPEGCQRGAIVGFISGADARLWAERSEDERRTAVLSQFADFFGPPAAQPVEYIDKVWAAERWSGGCYVGLMPPGVMTTLGHALREPIGRIHWAGAETATEWNGYMEGAVRSGERAAGEVLARMGR
ncbi:MAG: putative flavin-containing monoamine oxidase AofH [Candidatus Hydrogenedentota bacterium]